MHFDLECTQQIVCNESCYQICCKVIKRAMSGVFYLTHILQFIVHRLYHRTLSEQQLIIQAHQGVLHVLLYLGHQMYIVHKEHLKEVLTDIPPVCKEFSKQPLE